MITDEKALANISANVRGFMAFQSPPWTQADLARASGENEMKISRLIRGEQMPGTASLARIAEALVTTVDMLLQNPRNNFSKTY